MKNTPTVKEVLREMRALSDPRVVAAAARFGVVASRHFGITAPQLHALERKIGRNHALAQELWTTGHDEARWIAADALRELRSEPVQRRLRMQPLKKDSA